MEKIIVRGGNRLNGTVKIEGAKNSVLPVIAATLLASNGKCIIKDVPTLSDVFTINEVLRNLNADVEFENNVEKVTFTEVVGKETYIITIGSDGYFEGIGMSEEIKEELMELIVVGDLPKSEDNITDYFIKLREGLPDESP